MQCRASGTAPVRAELSWESDLTLYNFQLAQDFDPKRLPAHPVIERKWDGIAAIHEKRTIYNRDQRRITHRFPEVFAALPADADLVLEIVRLVAGHDYFYDANLPQPDGTVQTVRGVVNRMGLDNLSEIRIRSKNMACTAVAHDILEYRGAPMVDEPLHARRKVLAEALATSPGVLIPEQLPPDLDAAKARVQKEGWEGVVIKDLDAPYRPGRSWAWMKWKDWKQLSFPILRDERTEGKEGHEGFVIYVDLRACIPKALEPEQRVVVNDKALQKKVQNGAKTASVEFLEITADGRLRQPHVVAIE